MGPKWSFNTNKFRFLMLQTPKMDIKEVSKTAIKGLFSQWSFFYDRGSDCLKGWKSVKSQLVCDKPKIVQTFWTFICWHSHVEAEGRLICPRLSSLFSSQLIQDLRDTKQHGKHQQQQQRAAAATATTAATTSGGSNRSNNNERQQQQQQQRATTTRATATKLQLKAPLEDLVFRILITFLNKLNNEDVKILFKELTVLLLIQNWKSDHKFLLEDFTSCLT